MRRSEPMPLRTRGTSARSGERRVGEKWRSRGAADHLKKKKIKKSVQPGKDRKVWMLTAPPSGLSQAELKGPQERSVERPTHTTRQMVDCIFEARKQSRM